jgi:uncharacterized MAPEG superfamily protein
MQPELMLLLYAVALTFVQMLIASIGAQLQVGLPALAGNRENLPEIKGWAGRARRAHLNMLENLVLFAVLVLAAVITHKTNDATLVGAQMFFYARIVYLLIFLAGIPWVRTLVWAVSIAGLIVMFVQLV